MAKRKADFRFKPIVFETPAQAAHDAETVRLVREWAEEIIGRAAGCGHTGLFSNRAVVATEALAILTRKPAAKARTRAGGK